MQAGELRERMAFQRRAVLAEPGNDYGTVTGAWEWQFDTRARVIPLRRGEAVQAARLAGVQPMVVTVRSSSRTRDVTPEWRIVDARNPLVSYNIKTVEPSPDGATIDMLVEGGVLADG